LSLEETFEAIEGKRVRDARVLFETMLDALLREVAPSGLPTQQWKGFLTRGMDPGDSVLIREGRGTVGARDPGHHIQVIARATLLLRVATGACALLLREVGFDRSELRFWWKSLGEERGLWEPDNLPDEFVDLWSDVDASLDDIHPWIAGTDQATPSLARWRRECSYAVSVLGECERIALWGLGL
jgi:hypothetical protein